MFGSYSTIRYVLNLNNLIKSAKSVTVRSQARQYQDSSGETALHIAAGLEMTVTGTDGILIIILIEGSADLSKQDHHGRTVIAHARETGNVEVAS